MTGQEPSAPRRPLRFDQFVEGALYDPGAGFYTQGGGAGRRRDFLTSPEVGPLFGAVVARALDRWWSALGRPGRFNVVEAGAGPGTLARSIRAARPACAPAMELVLVEVSPVMRALHPEGVASRPDLPVAGELEAGPTVVLANELLDNLPFRLAELTSHGWREVFVVDTAGAGLREVTGPLGDGDAARCDVLAPGAAPGARLPLQDRAARWLADALALAADGGGVVVFDYATASADLARRPWRDWVRTYAGHGPGTDPLDAPGSQDITCEVAIDQLAAVRAPDADRSQAEWLRAAGIDELVDEGRRVWAQRAAIGDLAAVRARSRVGEAQALLDPAGLGAFRVLEWSVPPPPQR